MANSNIGVLGVDSSAEVVSEIDDQTLVQLATAQLGQAPAFWGRYFKGPGDQGGVHYNPATESAVLANLGIRVLPIAQQTNDVSGSSDDGVADAENNVNAIFAAFSMEYLAQQGGQFFVYLDVEGSPDPSLSSEFWTGWSQTLTSFSRAQSANNVTLLPALYCNFDPSTWQALDYACQHGATCSSAYLAHWVQDPPACVPPRPWNNRFVTPTPAPPCSIDVWQYAPECQGPGGIDLNMINPSTPSAFLNNLILPPSSTPKSTAGDVKGS